MESPFYGIVPGKAAIPLGQVTLPVTFGTTANFRTEYIKFEVADFETSYHAILGRPALAKFMAIPHYVYLILKMPAPNGVLSLKGDLKISHDCDVEAVEFAAAAQVPTQMMEVLALAKKSTDQESDVPTKKPAHTSFKPSKEVQLKTVDLETGNSSKTALIGACLDCK